MATSTACRRKSAMQLATRNVLPILVNDIRQSNLQSQRFIISAAMIVSHTEFAIMLKRAECVAPLVISSSDILITLLAPESSFGSLKMQLEI